MNTPSAPRYRYTLTRIVDEGLTSRVITFIMLNPSTADETNDDPTIRRCIAFARAWGYGRLRVGNLFAIRATDPRDMKRAADPIGAENDIHLTCLTTDADLVVCAWGQHGSYLDRANRVEWMLRKHAALYAIELSKNGVPKHPLYLRGDRTPLLYAEKRGAA